MLREHDNDLGDAISSLARFCENEADFSELARILIGQVDSGSKAIGVLGSRLAETNAPDSDLDILLIRPDIQSHHWSTNSIHVGTKRILNKGYPAGWIHLIKFNPNIFPVLFNVQTFDFIKNIQWQWAENQQNLDQLTNITRTHPLVGLFRILFSYPNGPWRN